MLLKVTDDQALSLLQGVERLWWADEPASSAENRKVARLYHSLARQMRANGMHVGNQNGPDGRPAGSAGVL